MDKMDKRRAPKGVLKPRRARPMQDSRVAPTTAVTAAPSVAGPPKPVMPKQTRIAPDTQRLLAREDCSIFVSLPDREDRSPEKISMMVRHVVQITGQKPGDIVQYQESGGSFIVVRYKDTPTRDQAVVMLGRPDALFRIEGKIELLEVAKYGTRKEQDLPTRTLWVKVDMLVSSEALAANVLRYD